MFRQDHMQESRGRVIGRIVQCGPWGKAPLDQGMTAEVERRLAALGLVAARRGEHLGSLLVGQAECVE
jgi:hypothetical protein